MTACAKCGSELPKGIYLCPRCGQGTGRKPKTRRLKIVALCVVTVIIGCCAAIGLFLRHLDNVGKQKRVLGEVRSIATGCQAWATDTGGFPKQEKLGPATALRKDLCPDYIKELPDPDLWGAPYLYMSRGDAEALVTPPGRVATAFLVISTGMDRKLDPETEELLKPGPDGTARIWTAQPTTMQGFKYDTIWVTDGFFQNPRRH